MTRMKRYAVYFAPRPGAFADRAAAWLGWDPAGGATVAHPDLPLPVAEVTEEPRRYGFHGTLRAPFRPAEGLDRAAVGAAVQALAARLPAVTCKALRLENLHGFIALTPVGCEAAVMDLAAAVVEGTNDLRAPLSEAEIARRRPHLLSARQRELLLRWGYPHVFDEFRFHLTLTGRLADPAAAMAVLEAHFAPVLPQPFAIEDLCLFGEDETARFHLLARFPLAG